MLLALISQSWKLALVHPCIDRLTGVACNWFLHLRFGILKSNSHSRQLPMGLGLPIRLPFIEPDAVSAITYSLFQTVAHQISISDDLRKSVGAVEHGGILGVIDFGF